MQLYFIRHGESANNALYTRTGSSAGRHEDPELTETGQQQARYLAHFLARPYTPSGYDPHNRQGFGLTHLYTSLMQRAVATGLPVAAALDLPLVAWEVIHEHGGIFVHDEETGERTGLPGADRDFFSNQFPTLVLPEDFPEGGWWNRPFEESAAVTDRAHQFLTDLLERHGDTEDRVAIISHGRFYQGFLAAVLGASLPETGREDIQEIWFAINNVAITRIDFHNTRANPVYFNRVDFLPDHLIT